MECLLIHKKHVLGGEIMTDIHTTNNVFYGATF